MKTLVVYDSKYGNTEAVARVIGETLNCPQVRHAVAVEPTDLLGLDLLVVGSPTQGGRPTKAIQKLLDEIPAQRLNHTRIAAFDTRIPARGFFLRALIGLIGYAAPKIDAKLKARGGTRAVEPQGFLVTGTEGPLQDGELARAAQWARGLSVEVREPAAVR
jgi:flavodoxin